jgi:L-fuculose-phosphate aldolase
MFKTEKELREDIVRVGQLVHQKGWVASNDGNISIRLDLDRVLCTPTNISKGMMAADDLIIVDRKGNKLEGKRERTSEILMHLTIYDLRPDVQAVVHTHPPAATGFAVAGRPMTEAILPEVVVNLGCTPIASYGLPGTPALTEPMLPLIPAYDAILLANHGAVTYAEDVWKAYFRMETVEHYARIALVANLLGGPNVLPKEEVQKLVESRARYGVVSRATGAPGCPVTFEDLQDSPAGEKFSVTREELIALVDRALKARGLG